MHPLMVEVTPNTGKRYREQIRDSVPLAGRIINTVPICPHQTTNRPGYLRHPGRFVVYPYGSPNGGGLYPGLGISDFHQCVFHLS